MAFLDNAANILALRNAVKARFSSVVLKQLTNDGHINPTTATIQDAKIDTGILDAASEFEQQSGFEPDLEDECHINAICQGVMSVLYSYKGTNHSFHAEHRLRFLSQCKAIRQTAVSAPGQTSSLDVADETLLSNNPVYQDMSRIYFRDYLPSKTLRTRRGFGDRFDNFI